MKISVLDKVFDFDQNNTESTHTQWSLLDQKDGTFHIIKDNKTYKASILQIDENAKTMLLSINGNEYPITIKDQFDILLEKLGMNNLSATIQKEIKAPMPGLVFNLLVNAGDAVKRGDSLLILEAMKMENIIKAPNDGVVKNIKIEKGQAVEKGQVLIEMG